MESHVRVLALIRIVFGSLGVLAGIILALLFGGAASIVSAVGTSRNSDALIALPIIGIVGTAIVGLVVLLSIPCLIAGIGLLKYRPWARILTIVLSALDLLNIPIGTAIGVYGLWVLLSPEGERLFEVPNFGVQQPRAQGTQGS